jgi:hypothetical protein
MTSGVTDHLWSISDIFQVQEDWESNNLGFGGTMSDLIVILLLLLISFACGYGIRELKSRHRRAAARKEYYRRHPEERS